MLEDIVKNMTFFFSFRGFREDLEEIFLKKRGGAADTKCYEDWDRVSHHCS